LAAQDVAVQLPYDEPVQVCVAAVAFASVQLRVSLTQAPLSTW
jgi:hypothetical protein